MQLCGIFADILVRAQLENTIHDLQQKSEPVHEGSRREVESRLVAENQRLKSENESLRLEASKQKEEALEYKTARNILKKEHEDKVRYDFVNLVQFY